MGMGYCRMVIIIIFDLRPKNTNYADYDRLTLLAIPLLLFPRFVLFLSTPSTTSPVNHRDELTALESFLCTHVGIGLLAVAIGLVTSIPDPPPISRTLPSDPVSGHPLLIPLSLALSLTSFIAYNTYQIGALGLLITIGCGFTGLFGLWVVLFQGTGNFSRKTGADKHTSSFLFSSKASASQQKKLWKKERERELEEQERLRWKK
ncbi:hypothetical protein FRC02_009930 [Tulasnella sp. 418]|nr:hypothetical protein FRC02_009930 [Tulasnella sp. 418]